MSGAEFWKFLLPKLKAYQGRNAWTLSLRLVVPKRRDTYRRIFVEVQIEFQSIVRPRSELQVTTLNIERKVEDVDRAGRFKDGGREPEHWSVVVDHSHRITVFLQSLICTELRRYYHCRQASAQPRGRGQVVPGPLLGRGTSLEICTKPTRNFSLGYWTKWGVRVWLGGAPSWLHQCR